MNVGKLDIDKILTNFNKYKADGYKMTLCICIRNVDDFQLMKDRIENTNSDLLSLLNRTDTIIIDWNDLNNAFQQFQLIYKTHDINEIISSNKQILNIR
jgi:hypothetical protein